MRRLAQRTAAPFLREAVRRSSAAVGVVLTYHAVAPRPGDPQRELVPALAVDVLRAQFAHLRSQYDVVPLHDLPARVAGRGRGDRIPVALTFDDDLASHVDYAAPLLAEHAFPATFFLTGVDAAFWWQDLQAAADRDLPGVRRRLAQTWPWATGASGIRDLAAAIERLPPDQVAAVADVLRSFTDPGDRAGLGTAGIRQLADAGFRVGFHTRRHLSLPALDDAELASALADGRAPLAATVGAPLTAIAYPFGHADARVAHAARAAGYDTGVVWDGRAVRAGQDPLLLSRVDGWASCAEELAWRLGRVSARPSR